eukprot:g1913.t1
MFGFGKKKPLKKEKRTGKRGVKNEEVDDKAHDVDDVHDQSHHDQEHGNNKAQAQKTKVESVLATSQDSESMAFEEALRREIAVAEGDGDLSLSASYASSKMVVEEEKSKAGLDEETAAIKIQAVTRGRLSRKEAAQRLEKDSQKDVASKPSPPLSPQARSQELTYPEAEEKNTFLEGELRQELGAASKELARAERLLKKEKKKRAAAEESYRELNKVNGSQLRVERLQMQLRESERRLEEERDAHTKSKAQEQILRKELEAARSEQRKAEEAVIRASSAMKAKEAKLAGLRHELELSKKREATALEDARLQANLEIQRLRAELECRTTLLNMRWQRHEQLIKESNVALLSTKARPVRHHQQQQQPQQHPTMMPAHNWYDRMQQSSVVNNVNNGGGGDGGTGGGGSSHPSFEPIDTSALRAKLPQLQTSPQLSAVASSPPPPRGSPDEGSPVRSGGYMQMFRRQRGKNDKSKRKY